MPKIIKYTFILILLVLIISIRFFENTLFYDPLIAYYKTDFLSHNLPELQYVKLFFSYLFRFGLNAVLAIVILVLLFTKQTVYQFTTRFYLLAFIVLIVLFFIVLHFFSEHVQFLFYIRRFLIQPLFLLLLIPAFYYQEKMN